MVEAGIESTSIWLTWREAVSLVMLCLGYTEEYAWVWIAREVAGGRIKAQRETSEEWEEGKVIKAVLRGVIDSGQLARSRILLPVTPLGVIDRDTGTLRFPWEPWETINNVELCLDGLVTAARLPASQDNAAGREWWSAARLYAWMIGDEPELTSKISPKILLAQLQLTRKIRTGRITPWDMSKPDEPKRVSVDRFRLSRFWGTTIVSVHGELTSWPTPKNEDDHSCRIMFYPDEAEWVFPRLDWLREKAERYAAAVRARLTKLNDLIALDEANRTDWERFNELVAMIGGNLENLMAEEATAARLVDGFSSVQANTGLRSALDEAEKIRSRIGDRFTESVHADRLEITGYSAADLTKLVTIPARFVPTDQILSLLGSGELTIFGQHYVGVRIGPPEPPEVTPDRQHAVSPSGRQAGQLSAEPPPEAASTHAKPPDQPQSIVPFRSGGPGRPTAVEFVVTEGKRRIEAGEAVPTQGSLTEFAEELHLWWETERKKYDPIAPAVSAKTLRNRLAEFWRSKIKR
jgi:hypothetical protein